MLNNMRQGRGMGLGRGMGSCRGMGQGRGLGYNNEGYCRFDPTMPVRNNNSNNKLDNLKKQADYLSKQLEDINLEIERFK